MSMILLGYSKGVSKKSGNDYQMIQVAVPCTQADNKRGAYGNMVDTHFLDNDVFNKLTPDMVGKKVDFKTSGFGFRAHIDEIFVVKE